MLDSKLVYEALENKKEQRATALNKAALLKQKLFNQYPQLQNLHKKSVSQVLSATINAIDTDNSEQEKTSTTSYDDAVADTLKKSGLPSDYLAPHFTCEICEDKGVLGSGNMCDCVLFEITDKMDQTMNLDRDVTFDNLDIEYIPETKVTIQNVEYSQRELYARGLNKAKKWTEEFPNSTTMLTMVGGVGVGKTYLAKCIANQLLIANKTTPAITTAFNIISDSRKGFDMTAAISFYLKAPLLIIDDFGSEPNIANAANIFLTVINERYVNKRHTIITTNLTPVEIKKKYNERLFSRMFDKSSSTTIRLLGDDLRFL